MRKTKEQIKQLAYVFVALILCVLTYLSGQGKLSAYSVRADTVTAFDNSPISEDLQDVSVLEYPKNPLGTYKLLRLTEFCYSERPFLAENYGLYLYVYNPTETVLEQTYNTVTMATAYDTDGKPAVYDRLDLKYLDCTDNHRFYKFKILAPEALSRAQDYAKHHDGERRYDISDIDLRPANLEKNQDGVSRTYYFSGYAKGCSDETVNQSTLSVRYEGLDTIQLQVNHTNYRMENEYKPYTYQEVNSVYFSVPQRYFDYYGGLQKIKSTWYEYKTNPVFVTSDSAAYAAFENYIGVNIGEKDESLKWRVLWEETFGGTGSANFYVFAKDYNRLSKHDTWGGTTATIDGEYLPRMDWLFDTEGKSFEGYQVSRDRVIEYIETYTNTHPSQEKLAGKYAENLFSESIDDNRVEFLDNPEEKRGKITQEIDAEEDKFDLMQYKDQSFWEKFWGKRPETETPMKGVSPISVIEKSDLELSKKDFCDKFLVNTSDYDTIINYCSEALKKTGEYAVKPVIFHFAVNDYYSSTARYDLVAGFGQSGHTLSDPDGYVAQETVFLDYKIISLTFRQNGVDTVVPVVSNPIDIINGFDPPNDDDLFGGKFDWKTIIKFILGVIGIILLLVLLAPVLPFIVQAVVWVITLPFKLIGALFKGISNAVKKRK